MGMLVNPFTKWLWDARRSLLVWSAAVAVVGGIYAAFWPTANNPELQKAIEAYPQALMEAMDFTDIATAAGYLNASVYGMIVPVLLLVYAITAGARIIAGDEIAGTLDLILAYPLSRSRLALQRFAAFIVSLVIMDGVLWLAILALSGPANLEGISVAQFSAMHLHLLLFSVFFGAVAYSVGAASGSKSLALGSATGVAVFGYLAKGIFPQVEALEWVENLSPFHWLNSKNPLRSGIQIGDALLMLGLASVLVAVGTWLLNRRDIAV
jgi:ABC-2 type transport system permease protein